MSDNRKKTEFKTVKRIVSWLKIPDLNTQRCYFEITYVLDKGELINDVRKKYHETVVCHDWEKIERKEETLQRSRDRLIRDLEQKIRATGAIPLNAKLVAQKLLKER